MKRICLSLVMALLGVCLSWADSMYSDSSRIYITDIQEESDGKVAYTNLPPGTYQLVVGTAQGEVGRKAVLQRVSDSASCPVSWICVGGLVLLCGIGWLIGKRATKPSIQSAVAVCPVSEEPLPEVQEDCPMEETPVPTVNEAEQTSEVMIEPEPSEIAIVSMDQKLIDRAVKYIENNISRSDLSVEELSQSLGMSRVHLYKRLLAVSGKTPIEFIRIIRLKRAAQLLRESQLNVSEIAYQVGFNNPKYFSKYFREEYGALPSIYQSQENESIENNESKK